MISAKTVALLFATSRFETQLLTGIIGGVWLHFFLLAMKERCHGSWDVKTPWSLNSGLVGVQSLSPGLMRLHDQRYELRTECIKSKQ
jgi:hypothetical protein